MRIRALLTFDEPLIGVEDVQANETNDAIVVLTSLDPAAMTDMLPTTFEGFLVTFRENALD